MPIPLLCHDLLPAFNRFAIRVDPVVSGVAALVDDTDTWGEHLRVMPLHRVPHKIFPIRSQDGPGLRQSRKAKHPEYCGGRINFQTLSADLISTALMLAVRSCSEPLSRAKSLVTPKI